ncbi:MAG: hypothetical protein IPQ07_01900 [Myxococcales bacterium]|nr:hypothetical protein [Myxococcales bacterium]
MSRTRFVSVGVAVAIQVALVLAVAASDARAEGGMLPNAASLTFNRLFITEGGSSQEPSTPETLRSYLNLAHCVCSQSGQGDQTSLTYEMKLSVSTGAHRPGELWVGTQCDDDTVRSMMCRQVGAIADIDLLATRPENVEWDLYEVINGKDNTAACQQREGDAFAWVLVDSDGDNVYDYFNNQAIGKTTNVSGIDTQPPPIPSQFSGDSAEGAVRLSWKVPESRATDVYYYQAFCVGPDGQPGGSSPPSPRYQTVRTLCGLEQDIELTPSDIASEDPGAVTLPTELAQLDPAYLCGDSTEATASGMLITGLQNDVPYRIVLLAIDNAGNATGTYFTKTVTPHPSTDFWEDLHDRGSNVEGGFCLLAETYGDGGPITTALRAFRDDTLGGSGFGRALTAAYYGSMAKLGALVHGSTVLRVIFAIVLAPFVIVALAWHFLTLPGLALLLGLVWLWRTKRLRWAAIARIGRLARVAPAATVALVLLLPTLARAGGPSPYWDGDTADTSAEPDDPEFVTWHAGIRVGPYVPDIDKQFGMDPGPYKEMYGGYRVMPMLDVHRIIWRGFGQVGVGGSLGYMQKTANSWADGSTPGDPMRPRSPGDETTFRLIPFELTAIYRLTWFDDQYGVPVVPYVRGGLAYYMWWVRTNGHTASACWDGTSTAGCDADKALGASLGVTGAIGLAIRAERIDGGAATSMRQSGIQHAGFYGELSLAKVDGFGSDTKLSVGDATWFAGVDFEF